MENEVKDISSSLTMATTSRSNNKKKIWVLVRRVDLADKNEQPPEKLHEVTICSGANFEETQTAVRQSCNITAKNLVFKMRNHRGSLIPLNGNLQPNSRTIPYNLEVVRIHQNIKPKPRTVKSPKYTESARLTIKHYLQRLEKLEAATPSLKDIRSKKLAADITALSEKLTFMDTRFQEAEKTSWIGMFKKHPLW